MSEGGDGSPLPSVQFRELDVEFLQKQAKIWLEAVLGERFVEDCSLADVLADGDILNRVSKIMRSLLQKTSTWDVASPKSDFPEASFYGKSSGKYLPYSNVDSFLKVCQKLGLTGVDLFSPPDVVEKKDIRRVCVCIRALSKKARGRQLDVPDFDHVTHTLSMPTGLVDGLRDSLKQASSGSPGGSPYYEVPDVNKETPEKIPFSPKVIDFDPANAVSTWTVHPLPELPEDLGSEAELLNSNSDNDDENLASSTENSLVVADHLSTPPTTIKAFPTDIQLSESTIEVNEQVLDPGSQPIGESVELSQSSLSESHDDVEVASKEMVSKGTKECLDCGEGRKRRVWMPFIAGGVALFAVLLTIRARESPKYEVKKGDTLWEISRRAGKSGWDELVRLNPGIRNPDLIYPSERLRLPT